MNITITNWKRNFAILWVGQAFSILTSSALQMAIIWHLTSTTGSALVLSLASLFGFLPQALFGPFAGVLVDRYNKKIVMIGADLFVAGAALVLGLVALTQNLSVWLILLILFLRSVGSAFHTPAISAVTPLIVPDSELPKCAGYSQSIQSVSYLLSPAIAGFLYGFWSLSAIIFLDVLGALLASIAVLATIIPNVASTVTQEKTSFFTEMKEGFLVIQKVKGLLPLFVVGALYMFLYMPINALFPLLTMEYFGGTELHASLVEIIFAGGMFFGGFLLGLWGGMKNKIHTILLSLVLMGISLLLSGLLPQSGFVVFAVCCGFMGLSGSLYNGVQAALIQTKVEPQYLGRVFALLTSIVSLAMPMGLVISGVFADRMGINYWFAMTGVGILAIAVIGRFLPSLAQLGQEQ